jgi:hypothetical protein
MPLNDYQVLLNVFLINQCVNNERQISTVVRPNLSPLPYRTEPYRIFSSGAYRFDGSPFTIPYRFLFFSEKRELKRKKR